MFQTEGRLIDSIVLSGIILALVLVRVLLVPSGTGALSYS